MVEESRRKTRYFITFSGFGEQILWHILEEYYCLAFEKIIL
jgi:hypothetical protein